MRGVHDRMPAILPEKEERQWLAAADTGLLAPAPDGSLEAFQVSERVNSPKNDGPDIIDPVTTLGSFS